MQISSIRSINPSSQRGLINNENKNSNALTHPVKGEFSTLGAPNFGTVIINPNSFGEKMKGFQQRIKQLNGKELEYELKLLDLAHENLYSIYNQKKSAVKNQSFFEFKNKTKQYNAIEAEYIRDNAELQKQRLAIVDLCIQRTQQLKELGGKIKDEIKRHLESQNSIVKKSKVDGIAKDKHLGRVGFDSIAGYDKEKYVLSSQVISAIKLEQLGEKAEVPGSILFFGPQGNGKSSFAQAFAQESGAKCDVIKIKTNKKNFDKLFFEELTKKAKEAEIHFQTNTQNKNQRTIFIVDEIDSVTDKYSTIGKQLNNFLETCSDKYHCTIFATTNYPEKIKLNLKDNNAIFPIRVGIDPPNLDNKTKVLKFYGDNVIQGEIDYNSIAQKLEGLEKEREGAYSNARIKRIVLNAKAKEDVIENINQLPPNISSTELSNYNEQVEMLSKNKVAI